MDATVYENTKIKGAATHALVIGVGHYRHLPGGEGQLAPQHWDLRQVSSPPYSARAFARWLIEEYKHPAKPLSSVSLLIAEKSAAAFDVRIGGKDKSLSVPDADMTNLKKAIKSWKARGNENPDNLLLFFFCGHGVAKGPELALLLSDFAEDEAIPLEGALDFRRFKKGMDQCAAREQCYFIDACRSESDLIKDTDDYAGNPVVQVSGGYFNKSGKIRLAPVFHSTLAGASSYATKKKPSHYTEALIEALSGAAAGDDRGPWQVRTPLLHDALNLMLRDLSERLSIPETQINVSDELSSINLNVIDKPWVPLVVTCDPELANAQAAFTCTGPTFKDQRRPRKGSWRLKVPIDSYDFSAEFAPGTFSPGIIKAFFARPIFRQVTIKLTL